MRDEGWQVLMAMAFSLVSGPPCGNGSAPRDDASRIITRGLSGAGVLAHTRGQDAAGRERKAPARGAGDHASRCSGADLGCLRSGRMGGAQDVEQRDSAKLQMEFGAVQLQWQCRHGPDCVALLPTHVLEQMTLRLAAHLGVLRPRVGLGAAQ